MTFVSRNRLGARIDGQNNADKYGFAFGTGTANVRIEGFDIFGLGSSVDGTQAVPSASGIFFEGAGDNSQVVGNSIHNISNFCNTTIRAQTGVFVHRAGVLVENNLFYGIGRYDPGENGCTYPTGFNKYMNSDTAVYLQGSTYNNVNVRNNLFYRMENGYSVYVYQGTNTNLKILNNTFAFGNPYCRYASDLHRRPHGRPPDQEQRAAQRRRHDVPLGVGSRDADERVRHAQHLAGEHPRERRELLQRGQPAAVRRDREQQPLDDRSAARQPERSSDRRAQAPDIVCGHQQWRQSGSHGRDDGPRGHASPAGPGLRPRRLRVLGHATATATATAAAVRLLPRPQLRLLRHPRLRLLRLLLRLRHRRGAAPRC